MLAAWLLSKCLGQLKLLPAVLQLQLPPQVQSQQVEDQTPQHSISCLASHLLTTLQVLVLPLASHPKRESKNQLESALLKLCCQHN